MYTQMHEHTTYWLCRGVTIEGTDVRGFVMEGPHIAGAPVPEGKLIFHTSHFREPPVEGRVYTFMSTRPSMFGGSQLGEVVDGKYNHGYVMIVEGYNTFRCVREITYRGDPELSEGEFLMVGVNFEYEPLIDGLYKYVDDDGYRSVLAPVNCGSKIPVNSKGW